MAHAHTGCTQYALSRPHRLLGLRDLINLRPPPESAWFAREDLAGRPCSLTHILLSHHINPSGALVPCTTCDTAPYSACDQIHVWSARQTSHCREQEEARQRAIERGEPDPFPPHPGHQRRYPRPGHPPPPLSADGGCQSLPLLPPLPMHRPLPPIHLLPPSRCLPPLRGAPRGTLQRFAP